MTRRIRTTVLLAGMLGMLGAACGDSAEPQTAVLLRITYPDSMELDQIFVLAYPVGDMGGYREEAVPDLPAGTLTDNPLRVLIVLPDEWADRSLFFSVAGKRGGGIVGVASTTEIVDRGTWREVNITLEHGQPVCNNGLLEAGEMCDGTALADTCETAAGLQQGTIHCTPECRIDVSDCFECGNGSIEADEQCDGASLGGESCTTQYFSGGTLSCAETCSFDYTGCTGGCGNLVAETGEDCDGADLLGQTCDTAAGLAEGTLACTPTCQLDISGCHECGNGSLESGEDCDGAAFGGLSCSDFGLGVGRLSCTTSCTIDTTSCCGDGIMGYGEDCDGTDFGGQSCVSATGNTGGLLGCTTDCRLDISRCHTCGNGSVEGSEECDGDGLGLQTCQSVTGFDGTLACHADCTFDITGCAVCGNGALNAGEGCDDGNVTPGDGCDASCITETGWICSGEPSECMPATCGDGALDALEVCDDGNNVSCDGCRGNCSAVETGCGDGFLCGAETCDDGNTAVGDGCGSSCTIEPGWNCTGEPSVCTPPNCGNGLPDPGEACDDGNNSDCDGCRGDCSAWETGCGDGFVCGAETCDDGNTTDCDGCSASCVVETGCGDGALCGAEVCDDGNNVNCDGCRADCSGVETGCGDGYTCGAEACDDGNNINCDGCRADCSAIEFGCGDGFVCGVEVCDDGNNDDCDGCRGNCTAIETGCGDGFTCGAEACDDGNNNDCDGCRGNCSAVETGCGDGVTCGTEVCDDGNTNNCDGCRGDCTALETGCGDGFVCGTEACDDGNTAAGDGCDSSCAEETGWSCTGSPSVCSPDTCGNASIDPLEVCDGGNLGGETCLSVGYRPGTGGLACDPTCTAFDTSGCTAGAIDSVAQLEDAISDAHALGSQQRIGIFGNAAPYTVGGSIVINECGGSCSGGRPYGVIIERVGADPVCFTTGGAFPVFDVETGENEFRDLCFVDAVQAYLFNSGTDAGNNTVTHNRFENSGALADQLIEVHSTGNALVANRFDCTTGGVNAIYVQSEGNTVAMNLISGGFDWAVQVTSFAATLRTLIHYNSIEVLGASSGGVLLNNADQLCYLNNIVFGDGTSTGLSLSGAVMGAPAMCGGYRAENNVNLNHAVACTGPDCAANCDGTSPSVDLCDLTQDPGWDANLCLTPGTNPPNTLVDTGIIPTGISFDHNDSTPAVDYVGANPDVGAREAATSRTYGGVMTGCP
ncbi:MAG: DUF4215 domain-containing protein [bacterium]